MRTFVGSVLESAGEYVVEEVKDGIDALRLVPRAEFDLVITDINMPDINGLELIHAIRQHPRHVRTPLIVITTNDRERGAAEVLTKPFTREALLATVARVMEAARTSAAPTDPTRRPVRGPGGDG